MTFVRAALTDPRARVRDISAIGEQERVALLDRCAGPVVELAGVTVPVLLDMQALATPDAAAVVHENAVLTYRELAARSDALARRLAECGAGPERLVAVAVPRSIGLAVALCAVLKAGAPTCP